MPQISILDLLGVRGEPSPVDAAVARWPVDWIRTSSVTSTPDLVAVGKMVEFLDQAVQIKSVRPGAFPGGENSGEVPRVGLTAEFDVNSFPPPFPLVFASVPKVEFYLQPTAAGKPARLYAQKTSLGVEWIIESVPVEMRLPPGFLMPLETSPGALPPDQQIVADTFAPGDYDTVTVLLSANAQSSIKVHVKLRVTDQFDFQLETAVPISIGPCRFSGIPCQAIHDVGFVLTPHPSDSLDARSEPLEWVRHALNTKLQNDPPGLVTVRSVDMNVTGLGLDDATQQANAGRDDTQQVEGVLEDLVLPTDTLYPVPAHFLVGVRRSIGPTDDPNGIFNLGDKPVVVPIIKGSGPNNDGGLYLILEQFLIRSVVDWTTFPNPDSIFVNVVISDDPKATGNSVTIQVTDLWTVEAGIHHEPPIDLFTLFGVHVKGSGARLGASFQKLFGNDAAVTGPTSTSKKFKDASILLADLLIQLGSDPPPTDPAVKLVPTSGKPTQAVVNDFGWKLGSFTIGSFWDPTSGELKAAGSFRLAASEFGFVTEPNGGRYFSLSGSLQIGGTPSTKPAQSGGAGQNDNNQKNANNKPSDGFGIQFYRVRWKIHGPRDANDLLIDGFGLSISYNSFSLTAFGMLSDYIVGDIRFREIGLALQVQFKLGGTALLIGGQFLHGHATGPSVDYTYLLAGLEISPIPISAGVQMVNVRGLFAWNLQPQLGTPDAGAGDPMVLFNWYQAHGDGVSLPASRNVSTIGWEPKEGAWAFAAGAGLKLGAQNAVVIDAFFLYVSSPALTGFLAAIQVFLFPAKKSPPKKPVAYGVVEVEGDHWSVLIGVSIGLENTIGTKIPLVDDGLGLTGTIYATNQPATFAIGHVNDTSSWLALHIGGNLWVFKVSFFAGICLEIVDTPDGPRAFGLRLSLSGGSKLCAVGAVDFYLTFELLAGVWRNESKVSGFVAWFEGGIKIDVLYVLQFGAGFKVELDYLGPDPAYRRVYCEVHISTPWWMPDLTFQWSRTIGQPQLPQMSTISTPLIEAAAHQLARPDAIAIAVSPLVGDAIDETATFNTTQVTGITPPPWPPEVLADAVPVGIDSTIALHFKASVDDKIIWGQITPPGMGTQASQNISTTYEFVELGIRRHSRFGPNASTWSTLLDPAQSRTDNPGYNAHVRSPLAMRWDADFQREQKLDPRHFLLNAEMPYLFFLSNFQNDENLVRNFPGWPCCPNDDKGPPSHNLTFQGLPPGGRAPRSQLFSQSNSTLRWVGIEPPVVRVSTQPGVNEAHLATDAIPEGAFAVITFDKPALDAQLIISWSALQLSRSIVLSSFRGLNLINEQTFPLSTAGPGLMSYSDGQGVTHMVLRVVGPPLATPPGFPVSISINSMGYQALDELGEAAVDKTKCAVVNPTLGGNGGRFAWLPNHDYEISIKTRVTVNDQRSGTLQQELPQLILFRTKGLPGLNATDTPGNEIEPYVESVYPAPGMTLYREEPAILAFNEKFDILQGLDQPPIPTDPDEKKQRLDWILAAELTAGNDNPSRATVPSGDWIVMNRGTGPPPPPPRGYLIIGFDPGDPILKALTRQAQSIDPLRLRFDAVTQSPGGCNRPAAPPRKMRVLSHAPVDPDDPKAIVKRWPSDAQLRMNMRVSGAPFIDRQPFETDDATSFIPAGGSWLVVNGVLAPVTPNNVAPEFAIFGDPSWEQFQLETRIEGAGVRAGVAIAITTTPTTSLALVIYIDESQRKLRIVTRTGNTENELTSAALPNGLVAPYTLRLFAYDDELQARVGDVSVSAPRDEFRAGRLAFAAEGAASFSTLTVDGIDAYRFEFTISRFDDFAAHIGSFSGALIPLASLAPPSKTIAQLLSGQAKFDDWISALVLPLHTTVDRLTISVHKGARGADLFVIESPEPLPIGNDVSLGMLRKIGDLESIQPVIALLDTTQCRTLVIPMGAHGVPVALNPGQYSFTFSLDRVRYRASTPDDASNLRASRGLSFTI